MSTEAKETADRARPTTRSRTGWWLLGVALAFAAGAAVVYSTQPHDAGPPSTPARKQMYQCPMHPSVVMDHPGVCPICGMTLVPIASSGGDDSAHAGHLMPEQGVPGLSTVRIDPERQQMIGLTTTDVARGPIGGAWRTTGRVAIDETRVRHVNIKVPGFVERIYVDFLGKPVKQGEALFSIYSPELLAAQEELLLALRTQQRLSSAGGLAHDGDALVGAAYRKLELWDIPKTEIEGVIATGSPLKTLTIYSPIAGAVTRKDVVQGMKLEAGTMPYEITDLSEVWVLADVYESELSQVKIGMIADFVPKAFPNRSFAGRATFMDPILDASTRTAKVRLSFSNKQGELRPGMFGEVMLRGTAREALRIPADAAVRSGTETYLFVSLGDGKFAPRRVALGETDGKFVEVISGVEEGERVIGRANFLIDSESRLRASLEAMRGAGEHAGHGK